MKLGSGRTRSRADGRNAGPGHLRRATRGLRRPIFSVQSVWPKEKARGSSCPHATARPWPCILQKSRSRSPGAHATLLLDQAGGHVSKKLPIPYNSTLLPFPPKSPELNPVENIRHDHWLSNRIFKSHEDILDHCCLPGTSLSTCLGKSCLSVSAWILFPH